MDIKQLIRIREDWPKEGISFKDITPLLNDCEAFNFIINEMFTQFSNKGVNKVLCADARGFFFGPSVALKLNAGLVPARKKGKLPFVGFSANYDLEYGNNTLEIPSDSIKAGDKVLIIDDLLATGGSAKAMIDLVNKSGASVIGCSFVIELTSLKGREKLGPVEIHSLVKYEI